MLTYQYKARDKFSKLIKGMMGAESELAVVSRLKQMGYVPVAIAAAKAEAPLNTIMDKFRRVKFNDINMFTRQFFTLQRAGLPLLSGLHALKEQASNSLLKDTIGQIIRDIESGSSLSAAMERHPKIFDTLYVNMIMSGESSGRLSEVLERLSVLGEHEEKIRLRIKTASRYPLIVVFAIALGFFVLTTMVIPRFARIYAQFTTALPLPTRILLWINYMVTHYWWLAIAVIIGTIFFLRRVMRVRRCRFWWDGFKLRLPVFGALFLELSMSRFSRITGMLMHSGVPILQILRLSSGGAGNVVISGVIDNIRKSVTEGKGISEPMKASAMFPAVVVQMVSVGEETGKLDELLLHVSDYYDSRIDYTLNNLVSLIEPLLTLVLGCVVLFMALGIFLPMWNMINLFRR